MRRVVLCAVLAACHEDHVLFADDPAPVDCTIAADGELCALGVCLAGACVPTRCEQRSTWVAVATGALHSCAIRSDDELWCWGRNAEGQLGVGDLDPRSAPAAVLESPFSLVAAGARFTCGVAPGGVAYCFGDNGAGQLGVVPVVSGTAAPEPVDGGLAWRGLDAGRDHTCGVADDARARCWGANADGELGTATVDPSPTPMEIAEPVEHEWRSLSAGGAHTCGVDWSARLYCWGANGEGQLGVGDLMARRAPVEVAAGTSWVKVAAGQTHTCAIDAGGALWCWGDDHDGELGIGGDSDRSPIPVLVEAGTWREVALGEKFSCGLEQDGTLFCWGKNDRAQLGLGDTRPRAAPERVGGVDDWVAVSLGARHACAVRTLGGLTCWGDNAEGQLGLGDALGRPGPVEVCAGGPLE